MVLDDAITRLEEAAEVLNQDSEGITKLIERTEERLDAIGVGLSVYLWGEPELEILPEVVSDFDWPLGDESAVLFWSLGYFRISDRWHLAVRRGLRPQHLDTDAYGNAVIEEPYWIDDPTELAYAERAVRVEALRLLGTLVDQLTAKVERHSTIIREANGRTVDPDLAAFKANLVTAIDGQADWRNTKAKEFPDDERNAASAKRGWELMSRLEALPADHPKLRKLYALCCEDERISEPGRFEAWNDAQTEMLSRYGFDGEEGDAEEFLDAYCQAMDGLIVEGAIEEGREVTVTLVAGEEPTDFDFIDTWTKLAEIGACDAPGGAEYTRVFREWKALGRPIEVEAFIRNRAYVGPEAVSGKPN